MEDSDRSGSHDLHPKLNGQIDTNRFGVTLCGPHSTLDLKADGLSAAQLARFLRGLDGSRPMSAVLADAAEFMPESVHELLGTLELHGVLDNAQAVDGVSGLEAILEIERVTDGLARRQLHTNVFWRHCLAAQSMEMFPRQVALGLILENYHFLVRESYFDAPVLSYVANAKVRLAMNAFYAEEYGHDELLMKSLVAAGYQRGDIETTLPLPATMALCNALAYWSHFDPLFFFTTLGLLEGQGLERDSFIDCCARVGLEASVLEPVRAHASINQKAGHGNLTRELFAAIPIVDRSTLARLRAQTHLFVELYDQFYANVWEHYLKSPELLRKLP